MPDVIWTPGPFICRGKIEDGRIVFCPPHAAAETLLEALIYAHNVRAECEFAKVGQEKAKQLTVLPYIANAISKARG